MPVESSSLVQRHPWWTGIAGNLLASALSLWWIGGKVMEPLKTAIGSLSGPWTGFNAEWVHDLGWLFLILALTNWLLFGRAKPVVNATFVPATPAAPPAEPPQPRRSAPKPIAESVAFSVRTVAIAAAAPGSLSGELEWEAAAAGSEILIDVRNVNPDGPPKAGVLVWLDDIREWPDGQPKPVRVRAWEEAPKGGTLKLVYGNQSMYYRENQRYPLAQRADERGRLSVSYTIKNKPQRVMLPAGLWMASIRVEWDGKSEARKVCFRSGGGSNPPILEFCPDDPRRLNEAG